MGQYKNECLSTIMVKQKDVDILKRNVQLDEVKEKNKKGSKGKVDEIQNRKGSCRHSLMNDGEKQRLEVIIEIKKLLE